MGKQQLHGFVTTIINSLCRFTDRMQYGYNLPTYIIGKGDQISTLEIGTKVCGKMKIHDKARGFQFYFHWMKTLML